MISQCENYIEERGSSTPSFLSQHGLRLLLFGGKGGVGKTTCTTATALHFARNSPRDSFLLVSTDPAHSLADSMAGFLPPPNLKVLELDAQQYLATFKNKHNGKLKEIASRGTFLDNEDISQLLELSMPGLDELISFLEISRWVEEKKYDCILVDTAPTGHTLRLLAMPELIRKWLGMLDVLLAKHRYMKKLFSGSYQYDEIDNFLFELSDSIKQTESLLQDPVQCHFVPVMLAEELSIRETVELISELERINVPITDIVINRLYQESSCPECEDRWNTQMKELRNLYKNTTLSRYTLWGVPLYPMEIRGQEGLDAFWGGVGELNEELLVPPKSLVGPVPKVENPLKLPSPETKLLFFAGKGGVGKTTLAAATAVRLAGEFQGKEVLLFSIDPAHSLSACLDEQLGPEHKRLSPGLTAMEIDAQADFESLKMQYQEELERFLNSVFQEMDLKFDREVMEKIFDLSPPGLDEVMALTRVMEFLDQGTYDLFIIDTAPTGHLIRFLELPELIDQWLKVFFGLFLKYKNIFRLPKVSKSLVKMSKGLKNLRALLRDPNQSALYSISILTEMSFQETKDLIATCERMGVNAPALFLNLATPASKCPLCSAVNNMETQIKKQFQQTFPGKHQTLIYRKGEPRGFKPLEDLGKAMYSPKRNNKCKIEPD